MKFKRPDRRVKLCWTVYTLCAAIVPFVASIVLFHLPMLPPWLPHAFTVFWVFALIATLTVYYPRRYRRMRYAVSNDAVVTAQGFLFTVYRQMPLSAVRHVTTLRGPAERMTGLAALLVSATGGHLLIEGLTADEADRLTQALL